MNGRWVLIGILLFWSTSGLSQNLKLLDTLKTPGLIDTLFIDRNIDNWSFRLFANYKEQRFRLRDEDNSLSFVPNNPFGVGFGIATRKLLLDIAFNVKGENENPTKRFDMQGNFMAKNNLFEFFLQTYRGFNVSNDTGGPTYFRDDIRSFSAGFSYMYYFNTREYSIAAVLSGLSRQKKSAMSFGLGGFLISNILKADSSLVAGNDLITFNEQAEIQDLLTFGVGIRGGYSIQIALPGNFFASATIATGIGLIYKVIYTDTDNYKPSNPLMYHYNLSGAIGYNNDRIYINMSFGNGKYITDLDFGNRGNFNLSKAKFAIGYKLKSKD